MPADYPQARTIAGLEAEVQRLGLEGMDLRRLLAAAESENARLSALCGSLMQEGAGRLD